MTIVLASCWGSDDSSTNAQATGLDLITNSEYQIQVPASWRRVTDEDISSPVAGSFELGYRSEVPRQGFYNNLVIISEPRPISWTAFSFIDGVVVRDSRQYASFESLNKEIIDLADGQESIVHTFRAKYNAITGDYIYLQSGALCRDKAYVITIGLHTETSVEDLVRYKSIMQSFGCIQNS